MDKKEVVIPLYDYKCKECGNIEYDIFAEIEERIRECAECGGDSLRVFLTAPRVIIRANSALSELIRKDQIDFEMSEPEDVVKKMQKQREETHGI